MGSKVTVWFLFLAFVTVRAIDVNLTKSWKQEIGWETKCSWNIPYGDSLQSVRLYRNNQQFMIYRPETEGRSRTLMNKRLEDEMTTTCAISTDDRLQGTCVLTSELYQPQSEGFSITCEVSGERPKFRIQRKTIFVDNFVPPTDAVVTVGAVNEESGQVTLNCTASGVPRPNLMWTIGEQEFPPAFKGGSWNVTSKLWQVWSTHSYTPSSATSAVCTPVISKDGEIVKGHAAEYNSATNVKGVLKYIIITVVFLILQR